MTQEDQARSVLSAARGPLATGMLAYAGYVLAVNFAMWVSPHAFVNQAVQSITVDFAGPTVVVLPIAAVALGTAIRPALPSARRVAASAAGLYAVALLLHVLSFVSGLAAEGLGSGREWLSPGTGNLVAAGFVTSALAKAAWLILCGVICGRVSRALSA